MSRFSDEKLYIELRILVDPRSNMDALDEIAQGLQESLYDDLQMNDDESLKVENITYEIVREVKENEQNMLDFDELGIGPNEGDPKGDHDGQKR